MSLFLDNFCKIFFIFLMAIVFLNMKWKLTLIKIQKFYFSIKCLRISYCHLKAHKNSRYSTLRVDNAGRKGPFLLRSEKTLKIGTSK